MPPTLALATNPGLTLATSPAPALPLTSAADVLTGVLMAIFPLVELLLPIIAIAAARPQRLPAARQRAKAALLALGALAVYSPALYFTSVCADTGTGRSLASLVGSIWLLASCIPVVRALFDISIWQSLFCVGAGYTIQNIASGTTEFIRVLLWRLAGVQTAISAQGVVLPSAAAGETLALVVDVVVYTAAYLLFVRLIHRRGLTEVEDRAMLGVLLVVVTAVIAFDVALKYLDATGTDLVTLTLLRFVHGTICCFVLFVQYQMLYRRTLEAELALGQQMAAERERQWQLSQENREAINVKMHDIRHQVRRPADSAGATIDQGFLASLAREVDVYDAFVETGNNALDTILSEKALVCEREAIDLSVIADGGALAFMAPAEIYSLFGNVLDNALQATREVDDPDRRSVSVVVRRVGALVSVHVENYFAGERSFGADGLPATTQDAADGHGFGMRSVRQIVERHGGTLALGTRGGVFTLNALIPVP